MFRPLKTVRAYRRIKRYRQVFFILVGYGFDDIVDRIAPEGFLWRRRGRRDPKRAEMPTPARLRNALTDLGPTFVKFGQLLSTRPDILPQSYVEELEKLQDEVPPFPFEQVVEIFREELGGEPSGLFTTFDPQPLASGSIAQVHKAVLKSGETVAVKVQRPKIRRLIETDLDVLAEIASLIERHVPEMRWLRPADIVRQFASTIRRELDFAAEAQVIERFRVNFKDDPTCLIPAVYPNVSTKKVLTTDFVDGVKITNFERLEVLGYDRKQIARNGAHMVFRQVFEHRLFHADPHPGNFFALADNVVAVVDFGIVGRLDEETTDQLGKLMTALVRNDVAAVLREFRDMEILGEDTDVSLLKHDLMDFLDCYHGLTLGKIDSERMIEDLLQVVRRHRIILPVNLALVGRLLVVSAGVGRMLDPDFDLTAEAKPFVERFLMLRLDPRRRIRSWIGAWQNYQSILKTLPADFEAILSKMKKGKMLVSIQHEGLNRFILEMDRSSNRIAFSLIIASLIVGSSLVMQLEKGPMVFGFPALGLAGYIIAGILGLWLVIAILRSGRI